MVRLWKQEFDNALWQSVQIGQNQILQVRNDLTRKECRMLTKNEVGRFSVTEKPAMSKGKRFFSLSCLGGRYAMVIGGREEIKWKLLTKVERLDVVTDEWEEMPNL